MDTFWLTHGVGEPWGTAIDASGNIWFAEPGCDFAPSCSSSAPPGQIGELNASSGVITYYSLPNISGNQPIFLAFDGSGKLWFTTPNNSMIGEFDPSSGAFVGQWPVTAGSGPWDLTFAGGKIWYTEHFVSAVGSFDPSTHAFQDFQTPSPNSLPYGIVANGQSIWFTENNSSVDRVAVLNTTTDAISEYLIMQPLGNSTPHLISIDASGDPWWTEGWSNTIATLNPAAATPGTCGTTSGTCNGISQYRLPASSSCGSGSHVSGIAYQSSTGLVWVDNSLTGQVGSFNAATSAFTMFAVGCNHPHDGLNTDPTGNVWFDEEFANALGEIVSGGSGSPGSVSIALSPSPPLSGSPATLTASIGDPSGIASVQWSFGDGGSAAGNPVTHTYATPGTQTLTAVVTANDGDKEQIAESISVAPSTNPSPPSIGGFAPTSGPVGSSVTISGSNFTGASAVAFNGTNATSYTVNSATQITATVPSGASSGPISVTTAGGTATSTSSFTVSTGSAQVASDSFNRTVSGGWGSADVGGAWTVLDSAASWSVSPRAGSISVAAAGQQRGLLGGVSVQDVDVLAKIVLPRCTGSGTNCDAYVLGRASGGSNPTYYRVGVVQGAGRSTVFVRAQRSDGSNIGSDLNTGIAAADGVVVWLRVEFQGVNPTAIRARAWLDGTTEPTSWLLNTTDSTTAEQTSGAVGVRGRNEDTATSHTFSYESYQATALA